MQPSSTIIPETPSAPVANAPRSSATEETTEPKESGGGERPDPTRYGDWEINGKCIDF